MTYSDINIKVPTGMVAYIIPNDSETELMRNAMMLYPYIKNLTISHGKAAEILGIRKCELIEMYDQMGLAYLDIDIAEVEEELECWRKLKGDRE